MIRENKTKKKQKQNKKSKNGTKLILNFVFLLFLFFSFLFFFRIEPLTSICSVSRLLEVFLLPPNQNQQTMTISEKREDRMYTPPKRNNKNRKKWKKGNFSLISPLFYQFFLYCVVKN